LEDTATVEEIYRLQDEEKLRVKMRRCISFTELRPIDEDFNDDSGCGVFWDLVNDPTLQNFISEPVSPREKEML